MFSFLDIAEGDWTSESTSDDEEPYPIKRRPVAETSTSTAYTEWRPARGSIEVPRESNEWRAVSTTARQRTPSPADSWEAVEGPSDRRQPKLEAKMPSSSTYKPEPKQEPEDDGWN